MYELYNLLYKIILILGIQFALKWKSSHKNLISLCD